MKYTNYGHTLILSFFVNLARNSVMNSLTYFFSSEILIDLTFDDIVEALLDIGH